MSLSVLIKPASGQCNMNCLYCFYNDESQKREIENFGFMTNETLKNVIRTTIFKADDAITYAFQGGEPTLRGLDFFKKLIEYEKQYNKNNIKVFNSIQTNASLLNDEWCEFFKENCFLVGVSLDGTEEIHNKYRKFKGEKSSYSSVMKGIECLEKHGVDYNILTVVNKDVAGNIDMIYKYYKKKGWKYQQYIECVEDFEKAELKYSPTPKEYGDFLIKIFDLWYEDLKNNRQPFIRQFENYIGILLGYLPESCGQRGICGIQYVVEADGSVYPCDFYMLDEYCIGNFNENRLEEIDENRKKIGFIEDSRNISSACTKCDFFDLCRGGCRRNKSMRESDYINYYCEGYKMFFKHSRRKLEEIADSLK